jgi:uncharacterized membrane protein
MKLSYLFSALIQFDESVRSLTLGLATALEGIAAIIIAIGVIKNLAVFGRTIVFTRVNVPDVRLALGRVLSLSLEFLLAADILETAVAPTWNDIGQLTAIAALRTTLNYFLEKELHQNVDH